MRRILLAAVELAAHAQAWEQRYELDAPPSRTEAHRADEAAATLITLLTEFRESLAREVEQHDADLAARQLAVLSRLDDVIGGDGS